MGSSLGLQAIAQAGRETSTQRLLMLALLVTLGTYAVYSSVLAVYRIYFHPLSKFPGARAACLSNAWLLRQLKTGHAEEIFEKLHRKYNTEAVRVGSNEVHLNNVDYYKVIYNQTSPFVKDPVFYDGFDTPHTLFAETKPALHKERRRLLNPYFSRGGVLKLEPVILTRLAGLHKRIEHAGYGSTINIYNAFRCLTVDVISEYAFGRCLNLVESTDNNFSGGFLLAFDAAASMLWDRVYNEMLRTVTKFVPLSIAKAASKEVSSLMELVHEAQDSLKAYQRGTVNVGHPIVFDGMDTIPNDQKIFQAIDILTAGSDTTAFSLATGLYKILSQPMIKVKLTDALRAEIPDKHNIPSLVKLEEIAYLNACVKEAIRHAMPVPGRLPRMVPKDAAPLLADGKVIPPGSVVGLSAYTMHNSEKLWGEDASTFNPDRWLSDTAKSLDQNMVSFSKGSRSCIGQNLATAEVTLVFAHMFRLYDMELVTRPGSITPLDLFTQAYEGHRVDVKLIPTAS